ncbi:MAG: glycosyl hydrolase family 43 [Leptospiraceae bacterium]|nr:glycosyl hydrolase family 43 [Leptospiraceae bacterium]
MEIRDFLALKWQDDGCPLIHPPFLSPIVADPTWLPPELVPDGSWRLFAHDVFGLRQYRSDDGLHWQKTSFFVPGAMRAFLYHESGTYFLYYEKYTPLRLVFAWSRYPLWRSAIALRTSSDFKRWSAEKIVLKPELPWHHEPKRGYAVGNPCLVRLQQGYALYYSAGLVYVPDCGFTEPRHIGRALAPSPEGPFSPQTQPILSPQADDPQRNLGAGAIKVLALADGFIGLQNGIGYNAGRSSSTLLLLRSSDGQQFERAKAEPLLAPSQGWRKSHIYACDIKYAEPLRAFVLYYNARDDWHWRRGRERIGRIVAYTTHSDIDPPKTA